MKKIIRLTENDLRRIVKRTINEMDKENILKGIIQGRPVKRREYSADDAIAELENYVNSNIGLGKNQLLRDMERISYSAAKELSDEEYEKFMEYYYELESQILQELPDDEEDDDSENIYESFDDMESTNELDEIVNDLVNNATFNDGREVFVGYGIDKTILGSWGRQSATRSGMRVFDKFFDGYCMSNYGITDMSDLNYIKNEFVTKMDMKINKIVHPYFY